MNIEHPIKAKAAAKLTQQNLGVRIAKEMTQAAEKINQAVSKGESRIYLGEICTETIENLKGLGYAVELSEYPMLSRGRYISW